MRVDAVSGCREWRAVVACLGRHDFAHTYDFHKASEQNGEGAPVLFVASEANAGPVACWPVMKRPIPGTDYFDFTSVYGYAGPLIVEGVDESRALHLIWDCMREYGAVSLFSRMHPVFAAEMRDAPLRGSELGKVVVVDVVNGSDVLTGYRASHRREILNSRRTGISVVMDLRCERLDEFVGIYTDSMRELGASNYYFFDRSHLGRVVSSTEMKTFILFAQSRDAVMAASMFIITGEIMQYYLSGTVRNYRRHAPSKAIIASAHEMAMSLGVKQFVLGGGLGSAEDALFRFKAGFSPVHLPFYVTRKVLDVPVYARLCATRSQDCERSSFFPAYRAH